jgi:hypothetical protein
MKRNFSFFLILWNGNHEHSILQMHDQSEFVVLQGTRHRLLIVLIEHGDAQCVAIHDSDLGQRSEREW